MSVELVYQESKVYLVDRDGFSRGYFKTVGNEFVFYQHQFLNSHEWIDSHHSSYRDFIEGIEAISSILSA
jgi:hypothetical protein